MPDSQQGEVRDAEPKARGSGLMARNHWIKALHGALLVRLGVAGTRAFWERHPLHLGDRVLTAAELAQHIRQEKASSPLSWTMRLVTDLEPFLLEQGVDFERFLEETRQYANHGTFVHPRHLLTWLGPILVPMFRFGNPYRLLLYGARLVAHAMAPGVVFELPSWRAPDSVPPDVRKNTGSVWVQFPGLTEGEIEAWDFTVEPGRNMLAAPRIFGLPPFAGLAAICDARSAERVPWGVSCTVREGRLFIDGVPYGRSRWLSGFLAQAGYELPAGVPPEWPVIEIERDYYCPQRKRVVLARGCAFGAPGYLFRLHWDGVRPTLRNFLSVVHAELDEHDAGARAELIASLHRSYLEAVNGVITVRYFAADGSVEVQGKHVCRGTPARILLECVRIARDEGRTEFTFRELKRLPALVSHPKNTGLEIRLSRLRTALAAADCGLRIETAGRGRFRLVSEARLGLEADGVEA